MTPVQTLYRWFNDNPEATYKEALEAYEHCLELEQQLPQPMRFHCVPKEISDNDIEDVAWEKFITDSGRFGFISGAQWYREQLKQRQ